MTQSGGYRNLVTRSQLELAHKMLATSNLRQFIPCEEHYDNPTSDIVVSTNETWNINMRIYSNVIVKKDATLTITCKVLVPEQGVITVEQGGRLIVNGGTVTRANTGSPTQFWRTIAAHGNPNNQAQGAVVRVINNGFIEGAVVGVTTGGCLAHYQICG